MRLQSIFRAVFGILLVPIYGRVSPQKRIATAKKRIFAALFESVLFRRNSALSLKAQGRMFLNGAIYFLLAIPPILILAIPCILVLGQCNLFYGLAGLSAATPTVIVARFADSSDLRGAQLSADTAIEISAPVRDPQGHEVAWRVTAPVNQQSTNSLISLQLGEKSLSLPLTIGESRQKVYPLYSNSLLDNLVSPSGSKLPEWLTAVEIHYPTSNMDYGLFSTNWVVLFLVISIFSGYIASKVFGVEV